MTRSADDKRARFLEAQHSPGVPAPLHGGSDCPPSAKERAASGAAHRAAESLRELHLFAGAGGGILGGMLLGHTPVCAVELDAYCRKVLAARQADGWLPEFPIYEDVREFDGKPWRGKVDVVAGGFPCQPWSTAGKRKGTDDPRHLWPEMARIVDEVRPRYVFAENVSLAAFKEPWRDLRGLGYRVPPAICVAAADVGAPHLRKRWWLLAYAEGQPERPGLQSGQLGEVGRRRPSDGGSAHAADTDADSAGLEGRDSQELPERPGERTAGTGGASADDADSRRHRAPQGQIRPGRHGTKLSGWWQTEPAVGRVVDGLAHRVDRLRALGNGQVPMAAATAWHYLMEQL